MSEKIYRPIVLILLVALVGLLVLQSVPSLFGLQPACKAARDDAHALIANLDIPLTTDYVAAVYDTAKNINQQQFLATEFNFKTLQTIAYQNAAMIELLTACP